MWISPCPFPAKGGRHGERVPWVSRSRDWYCCTLCILVQPLQVSVLHCYTPSPTGPDHILNFTLILGKLVQSKYMLI